MIGYSQLHSQDRIKQTEKKTQKNSSYSSEKREKCILQKKLNPICLVTTSKFAKYGEAVSLF